MRSRIVGAHTLELGDKVVAASRVKSAGKLAEFEGRIAIVPRGARTVRELR